MGFFRNTLRDLSDVGSSANKLKTAIIKLTKLLVAYSSGNHKNSKELTKQQINFQLNLINELAEKCDPYDEIRIYFPEQNIKTIPNIAVFTCKKWVEYVVEKNKGYSVAMLIEIYDRIITEKENVKKYPRAYYLISKRINCEVAEVKDAFLKNLSEQNFSREELEHSIKNWLFVQDEESEVLDLPIEETPAHYYADWTSELLEGNNDKDNIEEHVDFEAYAEIILNKGPGSPGETTRAITDLFIKNKEKYNIDNKELIREILQLRAETYRKIGEDLLPDQLIDRIVFLSQGNLPLAIFADIYATNDTKSRNLTETIVQNIDLIIKIIVDNYNDLAPEYLKYNDYQGMKNNIEILLNNWNYKEEDKMDELQKKLDFFKKDLEKVLLLHEKSIRNNDLTSMMLFQKHLAETYQHEKNWLISRKDQYDMTEEEITSRIDSVFEEFWNSVFE